MERQGHTCFSHESTLNQNLNHKSGTNKRRVGRQENTAELVLVGFLQGKARAVFPSALRVTEMRCVSRPELLHQGKHHESTSNKGKGRSSPALFHHNKAKAR